jgi:hypothetical protein
MAGGADKDRKAILRVIEEETAAFFDKDFEAWARCWVHAPYVRKWAWFARGGTTLHEGWEQESSIMKRGMDKFSTPNPSIHRVRRENINIRLGADMAWVTFVQHAPTTGDPFDVPGTQNEMRIVEKHGGEWKIAGCVVFQSRLEYADCPLVRVDEKSAVLWMNAAAEAQFKGKHGLVISAGRLRARNRPSDKGLQASIRWAANTIGYMNRRPLNRWSPPHGAPCRSCSETTKRP